MEHFKEIILNLGQHSRKSCHLFFFLIFLPLTAILFGQYFKFGPVIFKEMSFKEKFTPKECTRRMTDKDWSQKFNFFR